jgi:hypothetical protein
MGAMPVQNLMPHFYDISVASGLIGKHAIFGKEKKNIIL